MNVFRNLNYVLESMSSVLIKWDISSTDNVAGFKVLKSYESTYFMEIADVPVGSAHELYTYRDTAVAVKGTYYYKIKAYGFDSSKIALDQTDSIQVKIANIWVSGQVWERGSNAPFGLTNIYIENLFTGEIEIIKTDEYGNYSLPTIYGSYKFYINDIPGYEIAEERIKLDENTVRTRAAYKFPKKIHREDLVDYIGLNKNVLGDVNTDVSNLPTIFKTNMKHIADKFGAMPQLDFGTKSDMDAGKVSFVLEGTQENIINMDMTNGLVMFKKPPREYLYKTFTIALTKFGMDRIVVDDASNFKIGNYLKIGTNIDTYYRIEKIDYSQNLVFLNTSMPVDMPANSPVSPAILLSYYYMEFPEVLSVTINFYLIKTKTMLHMNSMRDLLPPSFWKLNIQDANFHTVLQMYSEEMATLEEDSNRLKWNNYLYDILRRDTEFNPPANEGLAPFHEVDRESIFRNLGIYIGKNIKVREHLDVYRGFVRAIWRILLMGPTGDARINYEVLASNAVGGEKLFNTQFYPIVEDEAIITKNYTGLGRGQVVCENLSSNSANDMSGLSYTFHLKNARTLSALGKIATARDVVVYGTTAILSAVDPVDGILYFKEPPSSTELASGVLVSYWYDNQTILYRGKDYYINWDTGEIELFSTLSAGDQLKITYVRKAAIREAVEYYMDAEVKKHADLKYDVDLKEFYDYNGSQKEFILKESFLTSDAYSKSGIITDNFDLHTKLLAHDQLNFTNSFFEVVVNISDNFDFRDEFADKIVVKNSGGSYRKRVTGELIQEDSLKIELAGGPRETSPKFLKEDIDYKFVNNPQLYSDYRVAYTEGEDLIRNGMGNNQNTDTYFKLRHKRIRNNRGENITDIQDRLTLDTGSIDTQKNLYAYEINPNRFVTVTGLYDNSGKAEKDPIKNIDLDTGELVFKRAITRQELLAGITISYWYDYYEELLVEDIDPDKFNVVEFYLDGGIRDWEEIIAYYYEVGRGLKRKDEDIRWILDIAKPVTTYYDLIFSLNVNEPDSKSVGNTGESISVDKYIQESGTYTSTRVFMSSDLNSLTCGELVTKQKALSQLIPDAQNSKKFYLGDKFISNSLYGVATIEDIELVNVADGNKIKSVDYVNGWIEFEKDIDQDEYGVYVIYKCDSPQTALIAGGVSFAV